MNYCVGKPKVNYSHLSLKFRDCLEVSHKCLCSYAREFSVAPNPTFDHRLHCTRTWKARKKDRNRVNDVRKNKDEDRRRKNR